jgi:small subunit ribosomal protein S21
MAGLPTVWKGLYEAVSILRPRSDRDGQWEACSILLYHTSIPATVMCAGAYEALEEVVPMIHVIVEERSNPEAQARELERAMKQFRRAVVNEGIFDELRNRRFALKPSDKKKQKKANAAKKRARRRKRARELREQQPF